MVVSCTYTWVTVADVYCTREYEWVQCSHQDFLCMNIHVILNNLMDVVNLLEASKHVKRNAEYPVLTCLVNAY